MSQSVLPTPAPAALPAPASTPEPAPPSIAKPADWKTVLLRALHILASLRLTVVLFALSIILVFYGTWAQVDNSVWTVVKSYFRNPFIAWIPLRVVFLYTVDIPGAIPYPGGWLLGGLLLANLLAAHLVRFRMTWQRSGIFLIHGGIVIMMLGELFTGLFQVEYHMTIQQGGSANHVEEWTKVELAVVNRDDPKTDDVFAIPQSRLRVGQTINHPELPFDVKVTRYMKNSALYRNAGQDQQATAGLGLQYRVEERPEVAGADTEQKQDQAAAYVDLIDKQTGKTIDNYLVSLWFREDIQTVVHDGKVYELSLRNKRSERPFTIFLLKGIHEVHPGIKMARTYASEVRLVNPETGEDRQIRIDMNIPLRYGGETFYQAGMYSKLTDPPVDPPVTILQVVRNPLWYMPYLACIVATLGMLIHFGLNLNRFLQKELQQ